MWGKDKPEKMYIKRAVTNALVMADKYKCISIAMPAISCGIFGTAATLKITALTIQEAIYYTVKTEDMQNLKVIRLVIRDEYT